MISVSDILNNKEISQNIKKRDNKPVFAENDHTIQRDVESFEQFFSMKN